MRLEQDNADVGVSEIVDDAPKRVIVHGHRCIRISLVPVVEDNLYRGDVSATVCLVEDVA